MPSSRRRPLLLVGAAGLTATLSVLGAALRYKVMGVAAGTVAPGVTPTTYLIIGCVMLYSAFHAISFGYACIYKYYTSVSISIFSLSIYIYIYMYLCIYIHIFTPTSCLIIAGVHLGLTRVKGSPLPRNCIWVRF